MESITKIVGVVVLHTTWGCSWVADESTCDVALEWMFGSCYQ